MHKFVDVSDQDPPDCRVAFRSNRNGKIFRSEEAVHRHHRMLNLRKLAMRKTGKPSTRLDALKAKYAGNHQLRKAIGITSSPSPRGLDVIPDPSDGLKKIQTIEEILADMPSRLSAVEKSILSEQAAYGRRAIIIDEMKDATQP
jgi:hypothetical protein